MRNTQLCAGGVWILGVLGSPLAAAQAGTPQQQPNNIETFVVTAHRNAQPIADVQASVQVFDKAYIEAFSGASLTEILRQATGVDARSSGANSVVSIRGQIPNAGTSVLLLVNGLPRPGKFGQLDLNTLPVEGVERIEVIRGPMSSLYGANAAGGVINVITNDPGDGASLSASLQLGGMDSSQGAGRQTTRFSGTANANLGDTGHSFSVDYRHADPYREKTSETIDDLLGIDHVSLTYSGQFQHSDASALSWMLEYFDQDDTGASVTRTGDEFERFERETRLYGALRWEGEVADGHLVVEGAYANSDARVNRSFPGPDETTDFTQIIYQGIYHIDLGTHGLLAGVGSQKNDIDISILSQRESETNSFVFAQDQFAVAENIRAVLGVRFDHFESFGNQWTPRFTLGSRQDGFTWRVGAGQAFRAPSVLEQFASFNRGRFLIVGSPDIAPEETTTFEIAAGWRARQDFIELVVHKSAIDNLIQASITDEIRDGLMVFAYQNISEAEIQGVELTGEYHLFSAFSLSGSYEYLDARDTVLDTRLQGRAKHILRAGLRYQGDSVTASLRSRHYFDFYGIDPAQRATPAFETNYAVVDASLRYSINGNMGITLGIDNVFDKAVPDNWSSTGAIEDPAGRFGYVKFDVSLD